MISMLLKPGLKITGLLLLVVGLLYAISVGFSPQILSLGHEEGNFHAMAQGILIVSYLLQEQ